MPRKHRLGPAGYPQHVIQRGNDRQVCFNCDTDRRLYTKWLKQGCEKYAVDVHAWVYMSNHVHLLVTPREDGAVARMMQYLGRHYVRYFNTTYERTGTLWEGRYHSCVIQADNYLLTCQRYIELNPVRAHLVETPEEYDWSSYRSNGLGMESSLLTPHPLYLDLGQSKAKRLAVYRDFVAHRLNDLHDPDLRYALNKQLTLGDDLFKHAMQALSQGGL